MNTKENIKRLLNDTNRAGVPAMVEHLEHETDFFEAPASTRYHCAHVGGSGYGGGGGGYGD